MTDFTELIGSSILYLKFKIHQHQQSIGQSPLFPSFQESSSAS